MGAIIDEKLKQIINDKTSLKVIASQSVDGELHVVYKQSLHVIDEDLLEFYEIIESSQNNKNMVNSIWYDVPVAINVLSKDGKSFEIKGVAYKAHVAGKYFEEKYVSLVDKGYYDLSTVWQIKVLEISEKTFKVKEQEAIEQHPSYRHLDQLLKA